METSKWTIDPSHSEIQFKVKHLMVTNVTGSFNEFSADVVSESDDFKNASIKFAANTASVDTGSEQRDTHLKSADFFDAEKYPELKFESTTFNGSELTGNLTIKGVTKPVKLNVEFNGIARDPWGNSKAGFSISGKINRTEWNLNWNAALEAGGVLVSEEVKLVAEVQLLKVVAEKAAA